MASYAYPVLITEGKEARGKIQRFKPGKPVLYFYLSFSKLL